MDEKLKDVTPKELFLTFSWIGLRGFGGVAPWVYNTVVEKKAWLNAREFGELLGMGQILPGPNVTNFSTMLGYRFCGWRGAIAATAGLLLMPFFLVLGLGILYQRYGNLNSVQGALRGIISIAAGLVLVTGIKLARGQPRKIHSLIFGLGALIAVGFLRWPLPWVVLVTGIIALITEWNVYE